MLCLTRRVAVINAVREGHISEAMKRLRLISPDLLQSRVDVAFLLKSQEYIEFVRNGDIEQALSYAQQELGPCGKRDATLMETLQVTLRRRIFYECS